MQNPPETTQTPLPSNTEVIMSSISIMSPHAPTGVGPRPDPITGADRGYVSKPELADPNYQFQAGSSYDESNYIVVGAVVRDTEGKSINTATVVITTGDPTQTQTMTSTGNTKKIGEETVYYYPFEYFFKTAGQHTITFTANGMTETLELNAS